MTDKITTKPDYGIPIIIVNGEPASIEDLFQKFFDDIQFKWNARIGGDGIVLETYTVATLPPASDTPNGSIIVSDETGGRTIATSDGTNWRRVADGAIVS